MANLTGKFNALQTFLTALFSPITTVLGSIDTKLDVIAQIGTDIATIKAQNDVIAAEVTNINAYVPDWFDRTEQILSVSVASRNALTAINIRDALMLTAQQSLVDAIGSETAGTNTNLLNSHTALRNSLQTYLNTFGGVIPPNNLTAMQLFAKNIASGCGCPGSGPSPDAAQTCEEPFFSTGILQTALVVETTELRNFASWIDATLPPGFSLTSEFGLAEDDIEIASSDWSNWWVYVDSDASTFSDSANPSWPVYKATREWHPSEAGAYANVYHVPQGSSIKVYLCQYAELPTACTTYDADAFIGGKQAYLVPPVGGLWTLQADDNFYVVNAANVELDGPLSAGAVHARASLPAGNIYLRMGTDFGTLPQRTVILCPPA